MLFGADGVPEPLEVARVPSFLLLATYTHITPLFFSSPSGPIGAWWYPISREVT